MRIYEKQKINNLIWMDKLFVCVCAWGGVANQQKYNINWIAYFNSV